MACFSNGLCANPCSSDSMEKPASGHVSSAARKPLKENRRAADGCARFLQAVRNGPVCCGALPTRGGRVTLRQAI